jgi:hypothetical protein
MLYEKPSTSTTYTQRRDAAFGLFLLLPALIILSHSTKGAKSLDQDVKRRCRLFMNGGQLSPLIRERDELAKLVAAAHVARCAAGQRKGETESAAQARKRAARITYASC